MVNTIEISGKVLAAGTTRAKINGQEAGFGSRWAKIDTGTTQLFVMIRLQFPDNREDVNSTRIINYVKPGYYVLITDGKLTSSEKDGKLRFSVIANAADVWTRETEFNGAHNSVRINGRICKISNKKLLLSFKTQRGKIEYVQVALSKDLPLKEEMHIYLTGTLTGTLVNEREITLMVSAEHIEHPRPRE